MDWDLRVHDAKTGAAIQRVESVDSTWSTGLAGDGTSKETFVVNDAEEPWPQGNVAELFEPNDRLIARWWGGFCMYAHKIDSWDYDQDAGKVTVSASDLVGETDWRLIAPVSGGATLTITDRSPAGAVRAALARMMSFGPQWEYPINLPPDSAGGFSGSWEFWRKYRISDILQQIRERSGAEIFLRPISDGVDGVRFDTLVGAPIVSGSSSFNLGADESPLSGVHLKVDGTRQVTGLLGLGNGTGQDQETKWIGKDTHPIPIRDTKQSFPDLTGDALQQATDTYFWENVEPIAQWSVGALTIDDVWSPANAAPGRGWLLESQGDVVLPDGVHALRVIKASGGNGRVITVEVQSA